MANDEHALIMSVERPEVVIAQRDLDMYREHFCAEAPQPEWDIFVQKCKLLGLNPMLNEVYLVGRNTKVKTNGQDRWVKKFATQVSITGLISLAERTQRYEGHTAPEYYDQELKSYPVWPLSKGSHPYAIRLGVYKKGWREASYSIIYFHERAQYFDKDKTQLTQQWQAQGIHMHLKCTLAAALRWAFQETCGGVYIHEEMGTADQEAKDITIIPNVVVESAPDALKATAQLAQGKQTEVQGTPRQIEAGKSTPVAINSRSARLNALYDRAIELNKFVKGATKEENGKAFLKWIGEVIGANIASAEQITDSRLKTVEQYLDSVDAA